jgi:hypothetical protein
MSHPDAEEKFREAASALADIDKIIRTEGICSIVPRELQGVSIDLDAAIPGLTGVMLGRALVLKAHVLYLLHFATDKSLVFDVTAPLDPMLQEGLAYALKGREMLEALGDAKSLDWAYDVIDKLGGNS